MSRPRRRMFGPFFYITVVIAVLLTAVVEIETFRPAIAEWLQERSLIRSLRADDSREREAAASALVSRSPSSSAPYLLELAHDRRGELRTLACRYLIQSGAERNVVVPILVAAASDIEPNVRHEAALALGRLAPFSKGSSLSGWQTESVMALHRLLKDQASMNRVAAADSLGEFGPDLEVVADLVAATADNERDVRLAATRALLKANGANDRSAGRTLVALVADPEPIADRRAVLDVVMSASEEVQIQAAKALACLLNDVDKSIDADVIDCLAALGPRARAALPALERLFIDGESSTERAITGIAVATIGGKLSPRTIPILLRIIDDVSVASELRQSALGRIRELDEAKLVKVTPILIRQLASKNQDVRVAAMEMLGCVVYDTPFELPAPIDEK
jgi:HEAT repeat protein